MSYSTPTRPGAHPEQVKLARVFSSLWLMGPPMSEKLVNLIEHLFSPEEARIAKHLPYYFPRTIETIARRARRPAAEVAPILQALAERRVILQAGSRGYALLPLIPGMFEYLLMDGRDAPWQRRYAQLINELFATGFTRRYSNTYVPATRYIPVETAVEHQECILEADRVSRMIDAHEHLAVLNVCQCRQSQAFDGKSCQRAAPEDGCLVFGSFAKGVEQSGTGRMVSRAEMAKIVKERWDKNLVFWAANVAPDRPNFICTCCDCCCHLLEGIEKFNSRVCIAEPHFLAAVDMDVCNHCGACVPVCNTHAHVLTDKRHTYTMESCIGCGLCVQACKHVAITMRPNPDYRKPAESWFSLAVRIMPGSVLAALKAMVARG